MNQPPKNDILKMQKEAEQRIKDMRRKADIAVMGNDMPPIPNFVRLEQNRSQQHRTSASNTPPPQKANQNTGKRTMVNRNTEPKSKGFDLLKMLNLKALHFDSDITMIIMLVLLLSAEESDELLLLALIYIML